MTAPQGGPPWSGGYDAGGPAPYGSPGGGYGPPGYGEGYGPPGYGYGPPTFEHPQGTMVLVLGILGIVMCQVLGPFAWVMGNRALAEVDAAPGRYSNRGSIQAGRICGIVATVLLGLSAAFFGLYALIIIGAVAGSST